ILRQAAAEASAHRRPVPRNELGRRLQGKSRGLLPVRVRRAPHRGHAAWHRGFACRKKDLLRRPQYARHQRPASQRLLAPRVPPWLVHLELALLWAGGPVASAKEGFVGAPRVGVTRGSSLCVVVSRLSSPRHQWSAFRAPLSHKKENYSISTRRNSAPVRDSRDSRACIRVSLVSCAGCKH